MQSVRDEINQGDAMIPTREKIRNKINYRVQGQVWNQARFRVQSEVWNHVWSQALSQVLILIQVKDKER